MEKRIILGPIFGIVAGIVCVLGNLPTIPIGSSQGGFLVVAFWNRVLLGLTIGLTGSLKLLPEKSELINALIRGAIIGMLYSFHLAFFSGAFSINYFLAGTGFGLGIDIIITKLST
jgi:hypothetical protein